LEVEGVRAPVPYSWRRQWEEMIELTLYWSGKLCHKERPQGDVTYH